MNNRKFNNIIAILVVVALAAGVFTLKNMIWKNDDELYDTIRDDEGFFDDASDENMDNMRETVLYYKNDNGFLVPVMRRIPWPEDKAIAKAALKNMTDDMILREDIGNIGLLPIIPVGTQISGMSIKEGLAKVDFTSEILNYDSAQDETALVTGIVYALTEFPTISEVQFMINGKVANSLTYGTDVSSPIARKDINLLGEAKAGQSKVVVYYRGTTNGEDEYYVPVTVPTNAPNDNMYTSLEELFKGPDDYIGLYTDIPVTAELLGAELDNGTVYINVSKEARESLKDQKTFESMTKNIALTLSRFGEIESVEILIDGETLEEAGIEVIESDVPVFANEY